MGPRFWREYLGRRVFLLLGRAGVGKGHVFTSLAGREGLPRFIAASWGLSFGEGISRSIAWEQDYAYQQRRFPFAHDGGHPLYVGAAFYNLSFSHEVASVFDRLTRFLERSWPKVFPPNGKSSPDDLQTRLASRLEQGKSDLKNDRRARLTNVLRLFGDAARLLGSGGMRILVGISNPSILYDPDGLPKNTGLGRLFDTLMSSAHDSVPIDVILLCSTDAVPPAFRAPGPGTERRMLRLLPHPCSESHRLTVVEHERMLDLSPCYDPNPPGTFVPDEGVPYSQFDLRGIIVCHLLRRSRVATLASSFFPRTAIAMAAAELGIAQKDISRQEMIEGQRLMRGHSSARRTGEELEEATIKRLVLSVWRNGNRTLLEYDSLRAGLGTVRKDRSRLKILQGAVSERFRQFANSVSKNRFAGSLLLSAADEQIGPRDDGLRHELGLRGVRFLDEAASRLSGISPSQKDETIVEIVLAAMERLHRERQPPPLRLRSVARLGPALHRLLLQILWHVSVIGEPVEARVLGVCPEICESLVSLSGAGDEVKVDQTDVGVSRLLQDALDLLIYRCLLFPAGRNEAGGQLRYGIHGLLQRTVFKLMETPLGQMRGLERFSLSLYIAQPSDLPRPSLEAHRRLRRLAESLAGYPNESVDDVRSGSVEALELWARRLRASFGIICSVYHVATIGRFDDYSAVAKSEFPEFGHFEAHRLLVRWLLRQAALLSQACADLPLEQRRMLPFYAEEIVWLLNESGVLSLAQGRINDATALFDQALAAAREWLAPHDAALAARIGLNSSLAAIERGATSQARGVLEGILRQSDEHPVVLGVARGLLGLTAHLAGELKEARHSYRVSIKTLLNVRNTRAASIFTRHLGDIYRARGLKHFARARELFVTAESSSASGRA